MADSTFTGLPAGTTPTGSEITGADQSGETRRFTFQQIRLPYAIETIAYAASITIDLSLRAYSPFIFQITLTGALALNFSNGFDGQVIRAYLIQDATGSRAWTPGAAIGFSDDISGITLSLGASKWDLVGFEWKAAKARVTAYNKGYV